MATIKELSIEEKAKRYDEAKEKAKVLKECSTNTEVVRYMDELFPELAESEDERIRKALIKYYSFDKDGGSHALDNITPKQIVAWLEKQGEQKPANSAKTCKDEQKPAIEMKSAEESLGIDSETYNKIVDKCIYGEQKPTDKVEPKFHEGDMIIHKELGGDYIHNPHKIIQVDILDKKYRLEGGLVAHFGEQDDYELVEQKPADDIERKYNPCYNMSFEEAQEYISNRGFDIPWTDCDVFVDFRYVTQTIANILCWADNNPKQKPAWSEEDEKIIIQIKKALEDFFPTSETDKIKNWFKSLKYRIQPKQEWSEEDEKILRTIISDGIRGAGFDMLQIDWIKSLRPQSQWKPSDEQMSSIEKTLRFFQMMNAFGETIDGLKELYQQLKKLKEE